MKRIDFCSIYCGEKWLLFLNYEQKRQADYAPPFKTKIRYILKFSTFLRLKCPYVLLIVDLTHGNICKIAGIP